MPKDVLGLSVNYGRNTDLKVIKEYLKDLVDNNQTPSLQGEIAVLVDASATTYTGKWNTVKVCNYSTTDWARITLDIDCAEGNQAVLLPPQEFIVIKYANTFISEVTLEAVPAPTTAGSIDAIVPAVPSADIVLQVVLSNT